jgi:hypothetical protein
MPTVEDHKEIAMGELKRLVQPDTTPKLDDVDLNAILEGVQRASFWLLSTAFIFGDVVLPATKNGHRYICTQGGTSAATEPAWPTRDAATITDGTVTWQEDGSDFENVFDVRAAAHEAWLMKEAKTSELFDFGDQKLSQIADRCREKAESFSPIKIA